MQIEEYFNFLAEDDIRIKGTRIGIESVLDEYINYNQTAEAIAERFIRSLWSRSTRQSYIICKPRKKSVRMWRIIWNTVGSHGKNTRKICLPLLFVCVRILAERQKLLIIHTWTSRKIVPKTPFLSQNKLRIKMRRYLLDEHVPSIYGTQLL